jgi:hypothetical protein
MTAALLEFSSLPMPMAWTRQCNEHASQLAVSLSLVGQVLDTHNVIFI